MLCVQINQVKVQKYFIELKMTNIFEKIVNDLNLEQKDVVESEDNLYVNATCPGVENKGTYKENLAQAIKYDGSLKRIIAITY